MAGFFPGFDPFLDPYFDPFLALFDYNHHLTLRDQFRVISPYNDREYHGTCDFMGLDNKILAESFALLYSGDRTGTSHIYKFFTFSTSFIWRYLFKRSSGQRVHGSVLCF